MNTQNNNLIDWEVFGDGRDRYLLRLWRARNDRPYLKLIRLNDWHSKEHYHGTGITLFEDNFESLIKSLSVMLRSDRLGDLRFGKTGDPYLIHLRRAQNERRYVKIQRNHPHYLSNVIVFEEDFGFLMEALTMLLTRYAYGERRPA